jgi:hypothetical protein
VDSLSKLGVEIPKDSLVVLTMIVFLSFRATKQNLVYDFFYQSASLSSVYKIILF